MIKPLSKVDFSQTPFQLCLAIKNSLDKNNALDHSLLAEEARLTTFTEDLSLYDFVAKHEALREKMVAAKYPNIDDEVTTVMFMIEGLRTNISYTNTGEKMLTNPPRTIDDFANCLRRLRNYRQGSMPLTTMTTLPLSRSHLTL